MALLVTLLACDNPTKTNIEGAYARVVEYRGDKETVTLSLRTWLNEASARVDGEPLCDREYVFGMPAQLNVNPVAWAYEQLKASGQLGETKDV